MNIATGGFGSNFNFFPPISLEKVQFTDHARRRFKERYRSVVEGGFTALELLSWATEEHPTSASEIARRNRYDPTTRYFAFENWRFIVVERNDVFVVLTFEGKNGMENWKWKEERKKRRRAAVKKRRRYR